MNKQLIRRKEKKYYFVRGDVIRIDPHILESFQGSIRITYSLIKSACQ